MRPAVAARRGAWQKGGDGAARFPTDDGNYLIVERQFLDSNFGACVNNATHFTGLNCDGDGNQIHGQGLFDSKSSNESGCGVGGENPAWKAKVGPPNPNDLVCNPTANVDLYLR
jgi:hypothetical protein